MTRVTTGSSTELSRSMKNFGVLPLGPTLEQGADADEDDGQGDQTNKREYDARAMLERSSCCSRWLYSASAF
ncbi:MAG TPA: hypothetical protein VK630_17610 [Reyranella sp.]|nr:hypothetical protein [Reyranella sp.]